MKGEINSNTTIAGAFNTPLTPMDRSTKQKISEETQTLNDTMGGRSQAGGGLGRGGHFLSYKFIKRITELQSKLHKTTSDH